MPCDKLGGLKYEAKKAAYEDYSDTFRFIDFPGSLMAIHLTWPAGVTAATLWLSAYYQPGCNQVIVENLQSEK